jgi:hypothetical protein
MKMITPDHVVEAVMNYYERGILPPIGQPKKSYSLPVIETDWREDWSKALPKAKVAAPEKDLGPASMDHPYIGGKFTLFVLSYGDSVSLLKRCVSSIVNTCPRNRYDLRIALNQPSPGLESYVASLPEGIVTKTYIDRHARRKYPAMREMFWDDACPIQSRYVCWFDDDSWCRDPNWLHKLSVLISNNHGNGGRLYGAWHYHDLMSVKREGAPRERWFTVAPWWKGRPLYTNKGQRPAANGSQIVFASGGFWALATDTIREANIPDERLNHNGGDITIGCQVTQAGYRVVDFSPKPKKEVIAWSDATRRGFQENFPWA